MSYVIDANDLLTYEGWGKPENLAADISQRHGCGVYIVIVDDYTAYGSGEVYDVTTQLYNDTESGFGLGDNREGILLLLSMHARDYALFVHGESAQYAFDDYGQTDLENTFLPSFGEDDWYGGFAGYLTACDFYLPQAASGDPVRESPVGGILMAVGISCAVALVICLVMKKEKKRVAAKLQFHSDQGAQYASQAYFELTKSYGIIPSMSRKGNPYDNAMAENFFSILKTECIYRHKPNTFKEANDLIDRYIHFYNHERIQNKTGVAPLTLRHSA